MTLTYRILKGAELTYTEGDNNIKYLDMKMKLSNIDPAVTNDSSQGFTANESTWFNYTTGVLYICTDATVGAAVWSIALKDTTYTDAQIKTKYEANADTNAFTDAEKAKLGTLKASHINPDNKIGAPTEIGNFNGIYNHLFSSGIMSGCALTDNLNGTINIATGEATLRATGDDGHGAIYSVVVPAVTNLALIDGAVNFVYLSYNDGITLTWDKTTDSTVINLLDKIPAYIIVRNGNNIGYLDVRNQNVNHVAKAQIKDFYTEPIKRKNGGAIVSDKGTLHLGCTAGAFFFQNDEYAIPALDTTGADTFKYYKHVAGAWAETSAQVIDNLYYDNGTDLVALANNKFGVHWIYAIIGSSPKYAVVYGSAEYPSIADAEDSSPLISLPPSLAGLGVLLGRAIVQKDAAELTEVQSSFSTTFSFSAASLLNYLQQGTTGTTASRPTANLLIGQYYFDTTLSKPIWWNGTAWTDGIGTVV